MRSMLAVDFGAGLLLAYDLARLRGDLGAALDEVFRDVEEDLRAGVG